MHQQCSHNFGREAQVAVVIEPGGVDDSAPLRLATSMVSVGSPNDQVRTPAGEVPDPDRVITAREGEPGTIDRERQGT